MGYLKICFLSLVVLFACLGTVKAQTVTTRVVRLEIDGKEIKVGYRLFLSDHNQEFEATVTKDGFVVPAELRGSESIGVRVVIGKLNLNFSRVHISKFDDDWVIGIDQKPFSREFADDEDLRNVKLIYYITFLSKRGMDTQLVTLEREAKRR